MLPSLSARRAWIEIVTAADKAARQRVALRKESVDRNNGRFRTINNAKIVALRKESVDRNDTVQIIVVIMYGRSPQGERG